MYLFQKLEEMMETYSDARRTLAEFALREQKNLYQYTIQDIADAAYTSKATVTRFAKSLGYKGWKDFIRDFVAELKYQEQYGGSVDVNVPFREEDSLQTMIENIKKVQQESLEDTAAQLDKNMITRAVNYLLRARRVVIFGESPNIYLGELFRRKMLSIGRATEIVRTGEAGLTSFGLCGEDCAVVISYAGNNEKVPYLSCVKTLKKQKVPVIAITSGGNNFLRQQADCVLSISSREHLYTKISNFATEESVQYLLNVLFAACFARNYEKNMNYKIGHSQILEWQRASGKKELKE